MVGLDWICTGLRLTYVGMKQTSYFRGRKLESRSARIPAGYTGVVLSKTDKILPRKPTAPKPPPGYDDEDGDMEEDGEDDAPNVRIAQETGTFEEIVVWNHETAPPADDTYIKGVEEWIALAQAVCTQHLGRIVSS